MNIKIEHKMLKVEFVFNNLAKDAFRFPIRNSIRISFWLQGSTYSSPSEITFNRGVINTDEIIEASILIINVFNVIEEGDLFFIGLFPNAIGEGIIKKVEDY